MMAFVNYDRTVQQWQHKNSNISTRVLNDRDYATLNYKRGKNNAQQKMTFNVYHS